jgi:hypothetical protein
MRRALVPFLTLCSIFFCLLSEPSMAADDQIGKTVTIYGTLRQSPQGGIELYCPQEPDVIYLPFDTGAIMSDYLNIKVSVKGEIKDAFTRQNKNYRVITVSDIKPMRAEYGSTTIEKDKHVGLPGSDPAEVHAYHNKTCYLYDHYAVLEDLTAPYDGHSLRVRIRAAGNAPDAICEDLEGKPLFEISNGGDFTFAGLSGDTLFVQHGAPTALHSMIAVNLAAQTQTLDAAITPGATIEKDTLRYQEKLSDTAANKVCPTGKSAMRPMVLNMKSGKSRQAGKIVCWP